MSAMQASFPDTWAAPNVRERARVRTPRRSREHRRMPLPLRLAASGMLWCALVAGIGVFLSVTLPLLFGFGSLTVLSGSMEPTLHVGDVVVVQPIQAQDALAGDIVTFQDPSTLGQLLTHRVHRMQMDEGYIEFETKGDANTASEVWRVPPTGSIGRVVYRVPYAGYVLHWMRGRWGRIALIVTPAFALGIYEVLGIWRPHLLGRRS